MKLAVISMIREAWGGSEELWYEMAKEALQQGHSVSHLSYAFNEQHSKTKELISLGMKEYQRPSFSSSQQNPVGRFIEKTIFFFQKRVNDSIKEIFKEEPDIVLYNGTCYSIAAEKKMLHYLSNNNCRFYILGHFTDEKDSHLSSKEKEMVSKAYDRCSKVFFVSERTKHVAEKQLGRLINHAMVVRNPVNISDVSMLELPSTETVQMAMVGNLITVDKGQDIVLKILAKEQKETNNWHLNIYGKGPDEAILKEMTTAMGLADKVTFHGKVDDIRAVWQKNHLLLMPSHMEGMPLALVEAMFCGRIAVVTNVGGNTEWIDDKLNGFIAEEATIESFNKAMQQAFHHISEWKAIGKAAHEKAKHLYDPHAGKTLLHLISS